MTQIIIKDYRVRHRQAHPDHATVRRSLNRQSELAAKNTASRPKVFGGDRYRLLRIGGNLQSFVIKPHMNLREIVQDYGICACVPGEFKYSRHNHRMPARAMTRPAVMRIANDADVSMPITVHIAIILKKPPGRRNTFGQIAERNTVERMVEASGKKIRPKNEEVHRGEHIIMLRCCHIDRINTRRQNVLSDITTLAYQLARFVFRC